MKWLLALAAALVLLFGCTGVSQEKYDALKAQCEQEKADSNAQLASKESAITELTGRISECNSQKQTLDAVIRTKDIEMAVLKNDSNTLMKAREKAERISQYEQAVVYYNDAYGAGKIPNSVRLNRIEAQVQSLNDAALAASWKGVRNCDGILGCENAKLNFTKTIDSRVAQLAYEIALIVK